MAASIRGPGGRDLAGADRTTVAETLALADRHTGASAAPIEVTDA